MYKAIKDIGGYKVGETVPTEKALAWISMYEEPHVEKVKEVEKEEPSKKIDKKASGLLKPISKGKRF